MLFAGHGTFRAQKKMLDHMKKQGYLKKLYNSEWGRILIAFVMTGLLFALVSFISPRVFFINDDENIMYTLSGYYTYGVPYDHPFINYCLAFVLRTLYRFIPGIQWYGVFHIAVLIASVTIIFKTVFKVSCYKKLPFFIPVLVNLALYGGLYLFPTTIMQFTTTSAMAGAASVVLLLGIEWKMDSKAQIRTDLVLSVLFLLLCYMHRKNTGYVAVCFFAGTVLFLLIKILIMRRQTVKQRKVRRSSIRRLILCVLAAVILLGAVVSLNSLRRSSENWQHYYAYDTPRFRMTDYPHDSYYENPELYQSLGRSTELYEIAGTYWWFFMDERINAESFEAISQTGYYEHESRRVQDVLQVAEDLFRGSVLAKIAILFSFAMVLLLIIYLGSRKNKKKHIWEAIYGVFLFLGALGLCLLLCYRQRLPLRALHTIVLPYVSLSTVLFLRMLPRSTNNDNDKKSKGRAASVILLLAVTLCLGGINLHEAVIQGNDRVEKSNRTLRVEEYAMSHPGTIYIYDATLTFRYLPFTVYQGQYPSNLFFWGGMGWNSPAFQYQLNCNGLDHLYSDIFLCDNVCYVTWDDYLLGYGTLRDRLERYMDVTYGDCSFEMVDDLGDGIHVYTINSGG